MSGLLFIARETVITDTFAFFAMSFIVGAMLGISSVLFLGFLQDCEILEMLGW
jgi:hypothetical protein